MNMANMTVLTFFAHPDDETLAAGATIKRMTSNGCTVHVAIPNTGICARIGHDDDDLSELRANCVEAMGVLGVERDHIYLGEFSDNEIDKHTLLSLIHWLEPILARVQPDMILTHHRYCTNIDHRYCHEAAVVATRPAIDCHIPILAGEVPSSTGYLRPVQWEPNFFVGVTGEDVAAKINAMRTYKGEARPAPHPRSGEVLSALAKVRGSESGHYFAEAFMIQRMFGATMFLAERRRR